MGPALDDFARALDSVERALDWELLGQLHCHEGGEHFFLPEQVEALRESGLQIAGALGEELAAAGGELKRSLYVGAAVAELVPMLVERFVLGRELVAVNLANEESAELNRAFAAAEAQSELELPRILTCALTEIAGPFDHGWLVSVLNDPEAFPALHDALYGRSSELATGRGDLSADLARAEELAGALLDRLAPDALLSTSDEELPVLRPLLAARGWGLQASQDALLTGVVGDPLRFLRLRRCPENYG
jgi:hypothetical protein